MSALVFASFLVWLGIVGVADTESVIVPQNTRYTVTYTLAEQDRVSIEIAGDRFDLEIRGPAGTVASEEDLLSYQTSFSGDPEGEYEVVVTNTAQDNLTFRSTRILRAEQSSILVIAALIVGLFVVSGLSFHEAEKNKLSST